MCEARVLAYQRVQGKYAAFAKSWNNSRVDESAIPYDTLFSCAGKCAYFPHIM